MNDFLNSLTIIIVIYNIELEDSESFQSILQMHAEEAELNVFVYDNSLKPQKLKAYKNIRLSYVHDPNNSGVSKAYNTGAENAKKEQKEWVLLLDQDTTLPSDILKQYNSAIKTYSEAKLIVPILQLANGKIFSPCSYRFKRGFYFQFVERFKKRNKDFVVMNVRCQQDFSDDAVSLDSQAIRFKFYCEGARNIEKEGIGDWFQYNAVVFARALKLTTRYRKFNFLSTYLNTFLFSKRITT